MQGGRSRSEAVPLHGDAWLLELGQVRGSPSGAGFLELGHSSHGRDAWLWELGQVRGSPVGLSP